MDAKSTEETKFVPPYIAWRTFFNTIINLEAMPGLPLRVDRTILHGSEGSRTQVLGALKSLHLITTDGAPTDELKELVSQPDDRPALVAALLRRFYPKLVELGSQHATQGQFLEALREFGIQGDTLRKSAGFYLGAAAYGGIPVSSHFRVPAVGGSRPGPVKRRNRQEDNGTGKKVDIPPVRPAGHQDDQESIGVLDRIDPAIAGVLQKIPLKGQSWTMKEKKRFITAFTAALDLSIVVEDEEEGA